MIHPIPKRKDMLTMTDHDFLYQIGLTVRKYRTVIGISQEELSARIDCDKNTIGRIERGESDVKLSTLKRLTSGLNLPCSRLIRESEHEIPRSFPSAIDYDYLRLFQYCHELSPEQFNNLCNTAHLYAKSNQLNQPLQHPAKD